MRDKLDFNVNKEKRTVTCIASDCKFDIVNDLTKKLSSEKIDTQMISFVKNKTANTVLLFDTMTKYVNVIEGKYIYNIIIV